MEADIKDEALELLHSLRHISDMIDRLQEHIDEAYTRLTSTTVKPKEVNVQTSGAGDQMAEVIGSIVEWKESLLKYQSELYHKQNQVLSIIKKMNFEEQNILIRRYMDGMTIEKIARNIGVSYATAWERLHTAEENFLTTYASDRII